MKTIFLTKKDIAICDEQIFPRHTADYYDVALL